MNKEQQTLYSEIETLIIKWNIDGTKMYIQKKMTINPRRIAEVHIQIDIPGKNLDLDKRNILEQLALNCPVAKSLHPDIKQEIVFKYV